MKGQNCRLSDTVSPFWLRNFWYRSYNLILEVVWPETIFKLIIDYQCEWPTQNICKGFKYFAGASIFLHDLLTFMLFKISFPSRVLTTGTSLLPNSGPEAHIS